MQRRAADAAFAKYGSFFQSFTQEQTETLVCQPRKILAQNTLSQFFSFSCDVYIEVQSGSGVLLVSDAPEAAPIEAFGLDHRVWLKPNVYFGFVATTQELLVRLYMSADCQVDAVMLATPYEYRPVLPRIRLHNIIGFYYHVRTPGYTCKGEKHPYFELTYVEAGSLYTNVDGVSYQLREKELILYGPNQVHSQHTDKLAASYVTILFEMENTADDFSQNWYSVLTDRIFANNKKVDNLFKVMAQESASGALYTDSLMQCMLTEVMIRLLQSVYTAPADHASGPVKQNYQEELFEEILEYMENKLYEPLTVADICRKFSLSRSTLQNLFKSMVGQSPKKYISDMKLEKSCQMLRQNKYTVSEISLKLGYSSIHYFSNAFTQKYHIPPSEYAKRMT
jgi:AraC-like DNA-binding protein/quercetin dioxygenase-like cupin family protein